MSKSDELYRKWKNLLLEQINKMKNAEGFQEDNHIRQRKLDSHIMYKVDFGTSCQLRPEGKNYEYEFVVEFDTETPGPTAFLR